LSTAGRVTFYDAARILRTFILKNDRASDLRQSN
jgi:hypothetical protein